MIHAVLIFNTSGVSRLIKFYTTPQKSPQLLVEKIFSLVSSRSQALCNFLDAPELDSFLNHPSMAGERLQIIYRNYATLYFVFVVDSSESELGILDLIQVFVESLDRAFENVCELDLVFNFDEAHHILSEVVQGGVVLETSVDEIQTAIEQASQARQKSFSSSNPLALGSGNKISRNAVIQTPLGWLAGRFGATGLR
ncbi:clathrin adaptor complex small chain-domain-containing protein [Thelephora terrestris]|uniref:AP complex subunit sigma n=1 Tax=Thelephora terrestris TaxID=56493 RepID=A0A9P6L7Y1_9AGAM|nr:clathrin adaptor complex small chain-domain-containing protein [Thelephora terrestris]